MNEIKRRQEVVVRMSRRWRPRSELKIKERSDDDGCEGGGRGGEVDGCEGGGWSDMMRGRGRGERKGKKIKNNTV